MADNWDAVGAPVTAAKPAAPPNWDAVGKPVAAPTTSWDAVGKPAVAAAPPKPPPQPAKGNPWDLVGKAVGEAKRIAGAYSEQLNADLSQPANDRREDEAMKKGKRPDLKQAVTRPFEAGGALRWPKEAMDVANAATSPIVQGPNRVVARGLADLDTLPLAKNPATRAKAQAKDEESYMGASNFLGRGEGHLPSGKVPFQDILAPATVSPEAKNTAAIIRGARGSNRLRADQAEERLVKAQKAWGSDRPEEDAHALIHHVESRSKGSTPPDMGPYNTPKTGGPGDRVRAATYKKVHENTPMGRAADTLRDIYQHYRSKAEEVIAKNTGAAPKFIEDYYVHLWADSPEKVISTIGAGGKQGSGRNFIARKIPTIQEGLDKGLTLKYKNPFEATNVYVQNMSKFLTTHEIQGALKEAGHAKWFFPGQAPEGWVPLKGIMTERVPQRPPRTPGAKPEAAPEKPLGLGGGQKLIGEPTDNLQARPDPLKLDRPRGTAVDLNLKNVTPEEQAARAAKAKGDQRPLKEVLYAHPDAARVYNNFVGPGFEGGQAGPIYKGIRQTANGMVMAKLGLSAFHAVTMGKEGMISEIARAVSNASKVPGLALRGDLKGAGSAVMQAGKSLVTSPIAPVLKYAKGRQLADKLLKAGNPEEITDPVMKAFYKAGNQLHMDDFYRAHGQGGAGSFFQSARRGSLKADLRQAAEDIAGKDKPLAHRAKAFAGLIGNTLQATAAPLFEHVIPALKQGAFASELEDFIKANPTASEKEITEHARKVTDSIDNRFGELIQDNLFWNRHLKQIAQVALTSFSWDLGTVREIAGGLKDLPESAKGMVTGKGVTPRTAYVAALAAFVPLQNAIYQRLKTGKDDMQGMDWIAPRTGGKLQDGQPERAAFPGYEKDVYGYALNPEGPGGEMSAKLSPFANTVKDAATDKDFAGHPIVRPLNVPQFPGEPSRVEELASRIADTYAPISFSKQKKGSAINPFEQAMGVRAAPAYIEDRDRLLANRKKYGQRDIKSRMKYDARRKAEEQ